MIVLLALSLIPSFIMLGGFKFLIYMTIQEPAENEELDKNLTLFGMIGALIVFFGRQFFAWIVNKNLLEAKSLL